MAREEKPVTLPPDVVRDVWSEIKAARDQAARDAGTARWRETKLNELLERMKAAGMADWIPTLEEVQAAWRGE